MNQDTGSSLPLGISSSMRRYTALWRTSRTFSFAGSITALLFCPVAWSFPVVPDAYYEIAVTTTGANGTNPAILALPYGSLSSHYCTIGGGVVVGCQTSDAVIDGVYMSVSGLMSGPSGTIISSASAIAQYYYAVIGPADVSVPMGINGSIGTFVAGGDPGGTQTSVTGQIAYTIGSGGSTVSVKACSTLAAVFPGCTVYPTSASLVNAPYTVTANTVQSVISSLGGSTGTSNNASSYSGTIDPIVNIDPTWLANNPGYSLVVSSNFAVPLPPAVWLFGSALGLMGAVRRKITS